MGNKIVKSENNYITYNINTLSTVNLPVHKNALLLTSHNTKDMEDKYVDVINWWIKNSSFDIYVVNSSGIYFKESFDTNRVTIFTFNQYDKHKKGLGSTYYELLSIREILENIPYMLSDYTMILKLTCKYRLPDLEKLVKIIPQNIDIILQNKRGAFSQNTELIGFKSDKIINIVKVCQDRGGIFERAISKIKSNNYITLRLPSIHIPSAFRARRGNNSILFHL